MLEVQGRKIPETLEEVVDPRHTILAIHDMQNYHCTPSESGPTYTPDPKPATMEEAVKNIVRLRVAAKKAGIRVVYTYSYMWHFPDWGTNTDYQLYRDREAIRKTGKPKERKSTLGARTWKIIDELEPERDDIELQKPRTDAFLGTDYHNLLRSLGIRTIIESGRSIEIGVEASARTAVLLGYLVVVARDCIMGRNPEHIQASMKWFERSVILSPMKGIIKSWKS